jgi:hypothetical protein
VCLAVRQEASGVKQKSGGGKHESPSWCVLLKMQDTNNVLAVYVGKLFVSYDGHGGRKFYHHLLQGEIRTNKKK